MGVLLGLLTAFFWGAGDFCARYLTQHLGTYRTLFWVQFLGLIALGIFLVSTGELQVRFASTTWEPWFWSIVVVLLNVFSSLALFRAFQIGSLALVSPIASSYAAVTVGLSLLSGETLTIVHIVGMSVVLIGIAVAATPLSTFSGLALSGGPDALPPQKISLVPWYKGSAQGVLWALVASLGYGTTFWLLGYFVTADLGGIIPVWLIRTLTPCVLLLGVPITKQSVSLPRGRVWWIIACVGLFDTIAYVAYTFGLIQGPISIVTILSSLYSAVTVLLAWLFLRERLERSQWVGILVIFTGIIVVNM